MHHDFWHERWRTGQTGFHQSAVHPLLERWWPSLEVPAGARVYVPLCGKTLDMAWLADRGHRVVGSELSSIAIHDFFAAAGLADQQAADGHYIRHAAGAFEILEGDALALTPQLTGPVGASTTAQRSWHCRPRCASRTLRRWQRCCRAALAGC